DRFAEGGLEVGHVLVVLLARSRTEPAAGSVELGVFGRDLKADQDLEVAAAGGGLGARDDDGLAGLGLGAVGAAEGDGQVEIFLGQNGGVPLGHGDPVAIGVGVALRLRTLAQAEQQVHVQADRIVFAIGAVRGHAFDLAGEADAARRRALIVRQLDVAGRVVENLHIGAGAGVGAAAERSGTHRARRRLFSLLSALLAALWAPALGLGGVGDQRGRKRKGGEGGQ